MSIDDSSRGTFSDVWRRVKETTPLRTLQHLADFTGSSRPTVSRKKRENDFPVEWAFRIARKYQLNTDWLMTGEDNRRGADGTGVVGNGLITGYLAEWIAERKNSDPDFLLNFQTDCSLLFPDFAQWLKRKRHAESVSDPERENCR